MCSLTDPNLMSLSIYLNSPVKRAVRSEKYADVNYLDLEMVAECVAVVAVVVVMDNIAAVAASHLLQLDSICSTAVVAIVAATEVS